MDIAVVVNLNARRGSHRVVEACRAAMPDARVVPTHNLGQLNELATALHAAPPELLVSAGGDGTAVVLLSALRNVAGPLSAAPPLAVVPLGTGNAWARTTGAPRWRNAFARLGKFEDEASLLPLRRFELVDVGGMVAPFAGTGWDATILDDYHHTKNSKWMPKSMREGMSGYMLSLAARSIPRQMFGDSVEVELVNLGAEAMIIDPSGRPVPMPGAGPGTVLYRGPMGVAGCGTTPDLGFGFRAFPFAGLVPGRFAARVYGATVAQAVVRMPALWKGVYPLPHDHQWMLTHCRMSFSRPVPFQIGGDTQGLRSEVEYKLASSPVDLVDWRALRAMERAAA